MSVSGLDFFKKIISDNGTNGSNGNNDSIDANKFINSAFTAFNPNATTEEKVEGYTNLGLQVLLALANRNRENAVEAQTVKQESAIKETQNQLNTISQNTMSQVQKNIEAIIANIELIKSNIEKAADTEEKKQEKSAQRTSKTAQKRNKALLIAYPQACTRRSCRRAESLPR